MKRFLIVIFVLACGSKSTAPPTDKVKETVAPAQALAALQSKDIPPGLDIRLSNGKEGKPAFDHTKLAPKSKLSASQVNALLARATPLAAQASDTQDFALRPASQPPPRTGNVIKDVFPAPASTLLPPASTDTGKELKVLRYMPEGNVKLAPELTITFNQPMVPVTSQDAAAASVPVKLTPTPKGHWRWIGTRTIMFDPDPRFPQATTYQVEIPSGTKSQTGGVLEKAVTFSFETPAIRLVDHAPPENEPQRLDAPIFIELDQKIDVAAMAAAIKVLAPRTGNSPSSKTDPWGAGIDGEPLAFHVLDAQEIAKHKELAATVEQAKKNEHEGRWLVLRTDQPMPKASTITVVLPPGTPSAEGPNKTTVAQTFEFETYEPMRIAQTGCQRHDECTPGTPLTMRFNNPIDEETFDEAMVTVTPALPDARIVAQGSWLYVYGPTQARTTYRVTIASKIGDTFGQTLGTEEIRSFAVHDAYPTFYGPDGIVLLDPASTKPTLDFFTTNYGQLKVKLFKVAPSDLAKYDTYVDEQWNHDRPPRPPGTKVFDQMVKTRLIKNELVETALDLQKGLNKAGFGHVVAVVEPYPWKEDYDPPRMITWVQATKIAVDAHVDGDSLVAFASELGSGAPAAGVELELYPYGVKGTTDAQGLATLALKERIIRGDNEEFRPTHLVAKRGDDTMFVRESRGGRYTRWHKRNESKALAWYVFDDRKLYKPGEEVHLKGWLRVNDPAKNGDIGEVQDVPSVSYTVRDSQGNQIGAGTAKVGALGSFDTMFTLPKTPNLGNTIVQFMASGSYMNLHYTHALQTEEFRRPEFEVSAHTEGGPFVVGGGGDVVVDAKYYTGAPLPGAEVQWDLKSSPTTFTPPNRDDYTFGNWEPWWGYRRRAMDTADDPDKQGKTSFPFEAKTDGTGQHILHVDVKSVKPAMPMTVSASASVTDLNRQQWSATTSFIVHPSTRYVGIKAARPFVDPGVPFDVDVIGVDTEGKAVPGTTIDVRVVRLEWEYKKGKYATKEVEPQMCAVVAARTAVPCQFKTPKGGTYELTATIVDPAGRPNQTTMTFWVSGGDAEPARDVVKEVVQIIPDKKEYTPGNTAELLVQAPFYPAEGVVTWRRSGIVKVERITMTGPTASLKVPITDGMTPNMGVQVDLVGMTARTDDRGVPDAKLPKRPAYAVGTLNLAVPPKHRTLAVAVTPKVPKLSPGETTSLSVEVKDAAGQPVSGAETTVIVVDESILALASYKHPDPIEVLYKARPNGTSDAYARAYVKLAKPKQAALEGGGGADMNGGFGFGRSGFGPGGGGTGLGTIGTGRYGTIGHGSGTGSGYGVGSGRGGMRGRAAAAPSVSLEDAKVSKREKSGDTESDDSNAYGGMVGEPGKAISIRSNFNPLAAFSASVMTGPDGKATVALKIPDNLTRYRVVAIAAWGKNQFGKGESEVTARLPLMVRPSPPRFLNFGDTFELPVTVQNQTDRMMTVKVAARATNARLTDAAGFEVSVPPNDRVEVRFPAAAEMAGTARFQLVGAAGNASDAANVELPVWTPATTEGFATYGVLDDGAMAQSITLPGQVVTQFGGVDVTTASTNLQALTDAVLYLVHYKFDCAEQRSSRMVAIAALRDVLAAFKTKNMPTAAEMERSNEKDIEHLSQMQNYDGGFAFWDRGHPSEPYLSVYVTNALVRAKAKGFSVPQNILDRAGSYLSSIETRYPWYYSPPVRWSISAYALYTRKLLGDLDIEKGQRLMKEAGSLDKMTMETLGWLLSTFAGNDKAATERKEIVRYAINHVSETAGAANFTTSYGDGSHLMLASERRVDGVMLEALILEQKDLDLIPKVVTGLLAHRKAGRWFNTQENAFVLLALDLYFRTYEKITPDFVARVWLGADYAGDHAFKGRTTETHQISIAMKDVAAHDKQDLTIQKDGAGRLYYRIGMTYAPASLKLDPADYGFVVARRYEAVDNPKDVTRARDGIWHIKAGARVRVTITMANENRRYHVALVDALPAGFEPMNPALATTGPIPVDPNEQSSRDRYWWWYGPWYEHQNMRDERVEAFAAMLWEGVHSYTYVARATTPGNFVVPPPKAEEMYMPETFGRGGSDRVIIK